MNVPRSLDRTYPVSIFISNLFQQQKFLMPSKIKDTFPKTGEINFIDIYA